MSFRNWVSRVACVAFAWIAVVQPVSAAVYLGAAQGAASTFVDDIGQGTPGLAQLSGALGDYNINFALSAVQPIVPAPISAFLSASVTANAAGTLFLYASQTDVPIAQAAYLVSVLGGGSTAAGAFYQYQAFLDPGNTPFGTTISLLDTGFQAASSIAGLQISSAFGPDSSVSFTQVFVIAGDVGDTLFQAATVAVGIPEPVTLAFFGPLVLLAGFARRRREVR